MEHIILDDYTGEERLSLLDLAKQSIDFGFKKSKVMPIDISNYSENLQNQRASFVTLKIHDHLRGCIGTLEPIRELVKDVVNNAYSAAFLDPRFSPVSELEISLLNISISILTQPEKINFSSEDDLLEKIEPGFDGLILTERHFRGTFLPSVWEELSDPKDFLNHLKLKSGLKKDYWSDTIEIERYRTININ